MLAQKDVCALMQMAFAPDGFAARYILAPAIAGGLDLIG